VFHYTGLERLARDKPLGYCAHSCVRDKIKYSEYYKSVNQAVILLKTPLTFIENNRLVAFDEMASRLNVLAPQLFPL
jgi:hypothetical protein